VKKKNTDVVKFLVEDCGYKLDLAKSNGVTALGIAAFKGSIELLKYL
jgi:hypothetical protein